MHTVFGPSFEPSNCPAGPDEAATLRSTTSSQGERHLERLFSPRLRQLIRVVRRLVRPLVGAPVRAPVRYTRYFRELRRFRAMGGKVHVVDLYPMLSDEGPHPVDAHYVAQAHWATARVVATEPAQHVDVASQTEFVAMLCAYVPVTFIDLRPLALSLPGLSGELGTVTDLPFESASVESLSSLHVLEHIGLGRYGDPLDPEGTQTAARELVRVLAPGGRLYVSLPIGRPRVEFNAHRVHDVADVRELFAPLELASLSVVDDDGAVWWDVDAGDGRWRRLRYGCGLFEFRNPVNAT